MLCLKYGMEDLDCEKHQPINLCRLSLPSSRPMERPFKKLGHLNASGVERGLWFFNLSHLLGFL